MNPETVSYLVFQGLFSTLVFIVFIYGIVIYETAKGLFPCPNCGKNGIEPKSAVVSDTERYTVYHWQECIWCGKRHGPELPDGYVLPPAKSTWLARLFFVAGITAITLLCALLHLCLGVTILTTAIIFGALAIGLVCAEESARKVLNSFPSDSDVMISGIISYQLNKKE